MRRKVMLGKIIGTIATAFTPIDLKLALANSIADPVEPHVNGLGSFLFDRVVGDTGGGAVISSDRCGRLGMAHFTQGNSKWTRFFAIVEQGTEFGFIWTPPKGCLVVQFSQDS